MKKALFFVRLLNKPLYLSNLFMRSKGFRKLHCRVRAMICGHCIFN